jgi:septum formation protein
MYQIILASESPRRKEIMETMGILYTAMAANVVEVVEETVPEEMVQALARLKTREISNRLLQQSLENEVIIIGADTMVFYQEHAMGKPKDEADAVRMLQLLSGDIHEVNTGVNILIRDKDGKEESISFAVCTKVAVHPMSEDQILDYIASGEPMDKAGAYAIQGRFGLYIKEIIGDYYNVVGFPIAKIYDTLFHKGIDLKKLK